MWLKIKDLTINLDWVLCVKIQHDWLIEISMIQPVWHAVRVIKLCHIDFKPQEWLEVYDYFLNKFPLNYCVLPFQPEESKKQD